MLADVNKDVDEGSNGNNEVLAGNPDAFAFPSRRTSILKGAIGKVGPVGPICNDRSHIAGQKDLDFLCQIKNFELTRYVGIWVPIRVRPVDQGLASIWMISQAGGVADIDHDPGEGCFGRCRSIGRGDRYGFGRDCGYFGLSYAKVAFVRLGMVHIVAGAGGVHDLGAEIEANDERETTEKQGQTGNEPGPGTAEIDVHFSLLLLRIW